MDVDEFQELMKAELDKWAELGVAPGDYKPSEGFLGLYVRMELLHTMLVEAGIFTDDELTERYRELVLERYKEIRENTIEPMIKRMRQEAIRAQIVDGKDMRIPRGKRRK